MSADPTGLDQLHDIVVPAPVPWWPPAPGWYWVIGFAVAGLFVVLIRGFIRWQHNRYRREALAELTRLEPDLGNVDQRAVGLLSLSELLKRTALTAFPREDVASLTGPEWFAFLDRTGKGTKFSKNLGGVLEQAIHNPRAVSAIDQSLLDELVTAVRHWIKHHVPDFQQKVAKNAKDPRTGSPSFPSRPSGHHASVQP